jgi:uncharacterized protein (DUF2267 family)
LDDVARGSSALAHPPEAMVAAVLRALDDLIAPGEVAQAKHVLPRSVRHLWESVGGSS